MPATPGTVIDTADWDLTVPVVPPTDLTGSRLTAALTPGMGGPTAVALSSDDGSIAWTADPVTGLAVALVLTVPVALREGWLATKQTPLGFDVHRYPPGSTRDEWFGRSSVLVLPASDSPLAMQAGGFQYAAARGAGQPNGRALLPAMQVGPQGARGLPGISATPRTYPLAVGFTGQTAFPLPVPPQSPADVILFVNGAAYRTPSITLTAVLLTWAGGFTLSPDDAVFAVYA